MTIRCRVHRQGGETVVAACDEDLLGETFREGPAKIEVKEDFYGGEGSEAVDAEALRGALEGATIANLTGEETVDAAVEMGFIDPEFVLRIDGVPHAQFVVM